MIPGPRHDEPCETVIVTVIVVTAVTAVSENVSEIVTVTVIVNANANGVETTTAPLAVEVDERSVHAKTTENEAAEVTLSPHEKYCVGQAAAKLVVGSVANETTEPIWPPAAAMSMKAVCDPHRRPWEQPVLHLLHPYLPQAVDGSVTAIDHANETTVKAAAVAVEAVIASVDVPVTMEAHMVKEEVVVVVVVDEVVEECGWAVRASDLDGACKHIFLSSPFFSCVFFFFFLDTIYLYYACLGVGIITCLCCISSDGFDLICISPIQLLTLSSSHPSYPVPSVVFPRNNLLVANTLIAST